MSKALFPACASFGPLFIVFGLITPKLIPFSYLGAVMTSAALHIIFRALTSLEKTTSATASEQEQ